MIGVRFPASDAQSRFPSNSASVGSGPRCAISGWSDSAPPGHQVHHSEAPRIGEPHECAVAEHEGDVLVVGMAAGRPRARPVLVDDHAARHAEMGEQNAAVVEIDDQVLGPPPDRRHGPPDQTFLEIGGQRAPQIAARDAHAVDAPPLHRAREAAADGFDLGKFGHAAN